MYFAFHLRSSPNLGLKINTAQAQLSYLKKNCLIETFPNVAIILRIYLTLPVANTEGECSFAALKRVKTYLRSSLTQDHVCDFCITAIEKSFTKSMSFKDIIDKFAAAKCRKLSQQTLLTQIAAKKASFRNKNSWRDCRAVARAETKLLSSFSNLNIIFSNEAGILPE